MQTEKNLKASSSGVEVKKPPSGKLNLCIIILTIALIVALTVIVGLAVVLVITASSDDDSDGAEETCGTSSCQELSSQMASRMDQSIDPCVDFYNFSCAQFEKYAESQDYSSLSVIRQASNQNSMLLSDILQNNFDTGGVAALQTLKTFYDSCMDTSAIDSRGVEPLLDLFNSTGGWDLIGMAETGTWDINGEQFRKEKLLGSSAFFSFGAAPDFRDTSKQLLQLIQSGLSFTAPEFYTGLEWNLFAYLPDFYRLQCEKSYTASDKVWEISLGTKQHSYREVLVDVMVEMLQKLNSGISTFTYKSAALGIADFEAALAQIFVPTVDERDVSNAINIMTVGNLSSLWDDYNWEDGFQDIYDTVGITIDANEPVNVLTPSYFERLHDVFSSWDPITLKNYAKWRLALIHIEHTDSESLALYNQFMKFSVGKAVDERVVTCVTRAANVLPMAIARPFVDNILEADSTDSIGEMVNEIKTGMKQRMNTLEWMDDFTRQRAKEKVDTITSKVGYPALIYNDTYLNKLYDQYTFAADDYFGNYLQYVNNFIAESLMTLRKPVDRSEYLAPPTSVNAYYYPLLNQIAILSGIIVPPFFRTDSPIAFRYGGVGGIIGHEITHGFDSQGRYYNPEGIVEQWWSDQSIQEFLELQQCFVDQYSEYALYSGYNVNGLQTLGENIADDGGIKVSYQSYINAAAKEGKQTLPGLPYTSDQLFFITWAQQFCRLESFGSYLGYVIGRVHSPGAFRVTGPMVNNPDFATAFKCPSGSPMNPDDKCFLW